MPSIELVSVGQVEEHSLPSLPFAIKQGPELRSHRWPKPLFQPDFDAVSGRMCHLGSPFCGNADYRGPFFAYELLSEASQDSNDGLLEFAEEFEAAIEQLLLRLLDWSPTGLVLVTTDWQFGPKPGSRCGPITVEEFWRRHSVKELRFNTLYSVVKTALGQDALTT